MSEYRLINQGNAPAVTVNRPSVIVNPASRRIHAHPKRAFAAKKSRQSIMMEALNPLRGLTLDRARNIFDFARRGCFAQLHYLYNEIEEADPVLFTCVSRRASAQAELDWKVVRSDARRNRHADQKLADEQIEALETAIADCSNLYDALEHLATAFFRGFAHVQPQWSADGATLRRLDPLEGWNFCYDKARGLWQWNPDALITEPGVGLGLEDIPPGELCTLVRRRHINYPALAVYVRSALGEAEWGRFLERYGVPPVIITMPEFADEAEEQRYMDAAQEVSDAASGAVPFGTLVSFASEARGVNPFEAFLNHQQQLIVLLATGGLLTSLAAPGSGTLAGNAHEETWRTIVRADSRHVAAAINRQICEPLLKRLFPGKPFLAEFKLETEPDPTPGEVFDVAAKARAAGYRIAQADLEEQTGYKLAADIATSGGELPVEGGRSMPFFGNRKLPCTLHPSPSTGGAAAQPPCKTPQPPCKTAANKDAGIEPKKEPPALKSLFEAFSADNEKLAVDLEKLLALPEAEQPAAAQALLEKLPGLIPEDPQLAALLAEEIAKGYVSGLPPVVGGRRSVVENKAEKCPDCGQWLSASGACTDCRGNGEETGGANPDKTAIQAAEMGKGKTSLAQCLKEKRDIPDAVSRGDIGTISFIYGEPGDPANDYKGGYGISHIEAKHGKEGILEKLSEVLIYGKVEPGSRGGNKRTITHGGYRAYLTRPVNRKNKHEQSHTWIITAFKDFPEKKKEAVK